MQALLVRSPPCAGVRLAQAKQRSSTLAAAVKKGFGAPEKQAVESSPAAAKEQTTTSSSTASSTTPDREEALEELLRRRKSKKGKVEPKVKVESAVVDMATGKTPTNTIGAAETRVVQVLFGFFGILLTEGLLLAGSGFLPSDVDAFVQDVLYPSYSPQMLLFLSMSSAYGLYKTGKLPGQKQL